MHWDKDGKILLVLEEAAMFSQIRCEAVDTECHVLFIRETLKIF